MVEFVHYPEEDHNIACVKPLVKPQYCHQVILNQTKYNRPFELLDAVDFWVAQDTDRRLIGQHHSDDPKKCVFVTME